MTSFCKFQVVEVSQSKRTHLLCFLFFCEKHRTSQSKLQRRASASNFQTNADVITVKDTFHHQPWQSPCQTQLSTKSWQASYQARTSYRRYPKEASEGLAVAYTILSPSSCTECWMRLEPLAWNLLYHGLSTGEPSGSTSQRCLLQRSCVASSISQNIRVFRGSWTSTVSIYMFSFMFSSLSEYPLSCKCNALPLLHVHRILSMRSRTRRRRLSPPIIPSRQGSTCSEHY